MAAKKSTKCTFELLVKISMSLNWSNILILGD